MQKKLPLIIPLLYSLCVLGACNARADKSQSTMQSSDNNTLKIASNDIAKTESDSKQNNNKYPMKLIWDNNLNMSDRDSFISDHVLNNDLVIAYEGMTEQSCYDEADYKACLANPPVQRLDTVFNAINVATPDLNNDNRRDLILDLTKETGISKDNIRSNKCGIEVYWLYENTPNGYKKIGTLEYSESAEIYVGEPKPKGQFRDIISKDTDEECSGEKTPQFHNYKFDYKKHKYNDF